MTNKIKRTMATLTVCAMILFSFEGLAQKGLPAYDSRINPDLLDTGSKILKDSDGRWPSSWITSFDSDNNYGVYLFRKAFSIRSIPESFLINISADNRYKLFVNGNYICNGPSKGEIENWHFDTIDIAPWLHEGVNVICSEVWNFAEKRPLSITSIGCPGFLVQGNGKLESLLNTDSSWKALRTHAYSPASVKVRGYYAAGCCDRLDAQLFPWGWEKEDFDDSAWNPAVRITPAAPKGARDYSKWQLVPRRIPMMEEWESGNYDIGDVLVPAWTSTEFIVDAGTLTTGYPRITVSGGKGGEVAMTYAEALYEGPRYEKGDRRVIEGKEFIGMSDFLIPDGGAGRTLEPLWWRTWRYIKVTVKTAANPLTIDGLSARMSMYPFTKISEFHSEEMPELGRVIDIGWRTARLCAHETYMDCPYYEQLQYFGDARIQALITMFNTRDTCMVRNLIENGRESMNPEGLTMSRYPSHVIQYIPPYSLFWIGICHDWWMYRGDETYLKTLLPNMRAVLGWFKNQLGNDNCLHNVPFWNFCDYATGLDRSGTLPCDMNGRSAYLDLIYIIALREAAEMENQFGDKFMAKTYVARANKIALSVKNYSWDNNRMMFADNGDKDSFSQHVNALAILAGLVDHNEASILFKRIINDRNITQCATYFRYYLQRAMALSGNSEMLLKGFDGLRDQMALGLTTWAEFPEPSRSDCHAWSSSPNIELFRMVLGIDSASPGFKKVRIEPSPNGLHKFSGSIPHPNGTIEANYEVKDNGSIKADIILPEGVGGQFVWNGRKYKLGSGLNRISTPAN